MLPLCCSLPHSPSLDSTDLGSPARLKKLRSLCVVGVGVVVGPEEKTRRERKDEDKQKLKREQVVCRKGRPRQDESVSGSCLLSLFLCQSCLFSFLFFFVFVFVSVFCL